MALTPGLLGAENTGGGLGHCLPSWSDPGWDLPRVSMGQWIRRALGAGLMLTGTVLTQPRVSMEHLLNESFVLCIVGRQGRRRG